MKANISNLINAHKDCVNQIKELKGDIDAYNVASGNKADFGNLCIALRGYEMAADAIEAMLFNTGVIITDTGDYFQKIDNIKSEEENAKKAGL